MQSVMTITCLRISRGARQVGNVFERVVGVALFVFLTTRFSVIIFTAAKTGDDDDDDADSVLGGESQVQLNIYDNAYVDEEENDAGTAAQCPAPTREKTAAEESGFEGSRTAAQGKTTATEKKARPNSEDVVGDLTTPAEKPAPAVHWEDTKPLGVTGSRGNILPRVASSSEAQQPTAAVAAGCIQGEGIVLNVPQEAKLLSVSAEGERKESEAQQPTAAVPDRKESEAQQPTAAVPGREEPEAQQPNAAVPGRKEAGAQQPAATVTGMVSNAPQEAKLPSAAAKGVRKESTTPRNSTLCGKTTNDIQSGKTKTTFSALDLPLPSGAKKKKKKKRKSST
jgi:hypothetical protein